jgi:hypothetical protein
MPWHDWRDDDELMSLIREALRTDPAEQGIIDAGRAIGAWHHADADRLLAGVLYDSYLDDAGAVRGYAPGTARNLVFALGRLRIEVELSDAGIEGQLIPPEPGQVWLLDATGAETEVTADEVGCFTFPATGRHVPIRIECAVDGGRRLATEWISS